MSSVGRDAAFIGPNENQFVILDEDKTGLAMYILPGLALEDTEKKLEEVVEHSQSTDAAPNSIKGPIQFMFEDEVDRIFSTPLGEAECSVFFIITCTFFIQ